MQLYAVFYFVLFCFVFDGCFIHSIVQVSSNDVMCWQPPITAMHICMLYHKNSLRFRGGGPIGFDSLIFCLTCVYMSNTWG